MTSPHRTRDINSVPLVYQDMLWRFDESGPFALGPMSLRDARQIKGTFSQYVRTIRLLSKVTPTQTPDPIACELLPIFDKLSIRIRSDNKDTDNTFLEFRTNPLLAALEQESKK